MRSMGSYNSAGISRSSDDEDQSASSYYEKTGTTVCFLFVCHCVGFFMRFLFSYEGNPMRSCFFMNMLPHKQ